MSAPSLRVFAPSDWLPSGKTCAVCFSVDDVHPGKSSDAYEAGGDLEAGGLGVLSRLLARQEDLRMTLFVTPDWRQISPFPTRTVLARIPYLRDRAYLAPTLPRGTMSLERHPAFVAYLKSMPRTELALHGLHHIHAGLSIPVEFQEQSVAECTAMLVAAQAIFARAGLEPPAGIQPPAWNMPEALARASEAVGLRYVAGARDVLSPVAPDATTAMSGPRGMSLIHPTRVPGTGLVHLTTNFQATSSPDRALSVLSHGGVLAIKAHIVKRVGAYVALDGVDDLYANYLDLLVDRIRREHGASVWFATMAEIADAVRRAEARR